jgi:hypothetical protein
VSSPSRGLVATTGSSTGEVLMQRPQTLRASMAGGSTVSDRSSAGEPTQARPMRNTVATEREAN